ncbi:aldehyde dehydrogenase family protein [Streptomyces sp. NPDC051173]|uniref:aldehyde dehydrogenase family protein n=1 Tax=Streptomyces sp. NPDC051173 TaxID=3155164 RepID=UPI00344CB459
MERTRPSQQDTGVLRGAAAEWAALPVAERLRLLTAARPRIVAVADRWVTWSCRAKGIAPGSPAAGEEWLTGPCPLLRYVDALARTLTAVRDGRDPLRGVRFTARPGGRTAVRVLPFDGADRLLMHGFRAEVWLAPGVDEARARAGAGHGARPEGGGVCVVLGAGNINSIAPLDVLHQLYAAGTVVLLKLNPVNDYLAPLLREVFAPFVARGFVRITTGGAAAGAALVGDPAVTAVHITGSAATHDAVVFGPGPAGAARKAAGRPLLDKPVTSELGGVGAAVVLPGPWRRADLRHQARHLAAQKLSNNGFNCVATQVVVLPEHWEHRAEFLDELRSALRTAPARAAYYPGAAERQARAVAGHADVELLDSAEVPRTLLPDLAPDAGDPAFRTEFFAPVLAVTALPGRTPAEFLDRAVEFCDTALAGTLGVNLVAHPRTLRALGPRFEEAVARLRYGTVGVNCWTAVGYALPRAVWGAYPGHTPTDVGSGIGVVHNALLLPGAERTLLTGPFRPAPRSVLSGEWALSPVPPWFVHNRTSDETGRLLFAHTASPSTRRLGRVLWAALRG